MQGRSYRSDSATVRHDQHTGTREQEEAAVNGPLHLASHEAARKDVDSLQEPDAPHEQTQDAYDIQRDAHVVTSRLVGGCQPNAISIYTLPGFNADPDITDASSAVNAVQHPAPCQRMKKPSGAEASRGFSISDLADLRPRLGRSRL